MKWLSLCVATAAIWGFSCGTSGENPLAAGGGGASGATGSSGSTASAGSIAAGAASEAGAGEGGAGCVDAAALPVSEAAGRSTSAVLAYTGDGYGVSWVDDRDGNHEIYFARVAADGTKVGPDQRLTDDPGESIDPSLVWTGSELGLAWSDDRDGNPEIYFTRLDASGQKLGEDVRVTDAAGNSAAPSLTWTGAQYALVWNDSRDTSYQIYFVTLSETGTKQGGESRVTTGSALSASPALAVAGDGFGLAWHDTRDGAGLQVYFANLDASGQLVGAERLRSDLSSRGGDPALAFDGSHFGLAWQDNPGTGGPVLFAQLDAQGAVAKSAVPVSRGNGTKGGRALAPRAAGGFALAWSDSRSSSPGLYLAEFDAAGDPVGSDLPVATGSSSATAQAIAAAGSRYALTWLDSASDTSGEVFLNVACAP